MSAHSEMVFTGSGDFRLYLGRLCGEYGSRLPLKAITEHGAALQTGSDQS